MDIFGQQESGGQERRFASRRTSPRALLPWLLSIAVHGVVFAAVDWPALISGEQGFASGAEGGGLYATLVLRTKTQPAGSAAMDVRRPETQQRPLERPTPIVARAHDNQVSVPSPIAAASARTPVMQARSVSAQSQPESFQTVPEYSEPARRQKQTRVPFSEPPPLATSLPDSQAPSMTLAAVQVSGLSGLPKPVSSTKGSGAASGNAASGGVANPVDDYRDRLKAVAQRELRYPERARRFGWEGTVEVVLRLTMGHAEPVIHVTASSGRHVLDDEAVALIRRAARRVPPPALSAGGSLALNFPVRFSLDDARSLR